MRRFLAGFSLMALSTLATLAVAEVVVRILSPPLWWPDRRRVASAVNPVHPAPKPGPAILLLGDSYAYGSGIGRWLDTLSGRLSAKLGVQVVNRAVPASMTREWVEEAEKARREREWVDVIVSWSPRDGVAYSDGLETLLDIYDAPLQSRSALLTWMRDRWTR